MPVYLRKNVVFTPPSIYNISDEDDDDYIQDPEQIRDSLPQPYRMIDKLINGIFDDVWEIISVKESERIAEQSKIRPPKYDCAVELENEARSNTTSLGDSGEGRYVFIGLPNGLAVMDAGTQKPVTQWEEDNTEIIKLKVHIMGVQTYLIVTLDDMGTARLFAFGFDNLFLLKVLNEQEGGIKNLVTKCESSKEGDYVGIVLENTSSNETWLEIHKLPRDAWLRELEAIQAQICPKRPGSPQGEQSGDANNTESQGTDGEASQDRSGSPKPSTPPPGAPFDKSSYKFAVPNIVLRVNPPPPLKANSSSSTYSACQKVDSGEVIGTGQTHLLTTSHLDGRDTMFDHLHEGLLKYLPKDNVENERVIIPTFHFLPAGRMVPLGLEQPSQTGVPTTVAVWWTGAAHIQHYSLLKTAKDIEHKPDVVWPMSCKIQCTALSPCGSLMAIGMENGTMVLWDRYLGINKGVIRVSQKFPVVCVKFLDPVILLPVCQGYPPYRKKSSISILIQCHNGAEYIYNTSEGPHAPAVCLAAEPDTDDEFETILETMPDVPELLLVVQRNGSLILKDVTTGANLCQMNLPPTHQLTNTWDPVLTFGAGGQFLYVKGTKIEIEDNVDTEPEDGPQPPQEQSSLFMFQLRSFPSLDPYWKRDREATQYLVHTTLDQRLDALMKERLAQQALRKPRMQMRWNMLRQELDLIKQAKDLAKRNSSRASLP